MLTKFETKSSRVKGLSFHPKRPWILASLHNGVIQLWDFRMGTLIDRFEEHEGPVRGLDFHNSQPMFVSGGDDYKIKVWNYKQKRCLFTLLGHLDYIRTVEFHHEHPWIISASDDQTIRIWNWQSRNCISVLTGHNHYVMSASFHPTDDLIVSASLDFTVRVWDFKALRQKMEGTSQSSDRRGRGNQDLFGSSDVDVKFVLQSHTRGVNWASFHPTLPLIVSGADDRTVRLWRMGESRAWEVDTLRGHYNNVSCCLFHPKQDLIISNSEDKTIRVWDTSKRQGVQTYRMENDRFWILCAHPELNIFAAGHDSGMIVFKLERERPAFALHESHLYYVGDNFLRCADLKSSRDVPLVNLKRSSTSGQPLVKPKYMRYSATDNALLLFADGATGSTASPAGKYEIIPLPSSSNGAVEPDKFRAGSALDVAWIGRQRFVALHKDNSLLVRNEADQLVKKIPLTVSGVDALYPATTGHVLLRTEDKMHLFDLTRQSAVAAVAVPHVKYVVLSPAKDKFAFLAKHVVYLVSTKLELLSTVHETIRIKSGAFSPNGVFIYSTLNHLKYVLPNGDGGIIKTLDNPMYIACIDPSGNVVYGLDRDGHVRSFQINPMEFLFKQALDAQQFEKVLRMIREKTIPGHAIIAYLQKKGYPEIALHFVKDVQAKFKLAIECGNIEIALECAKAMDTEEAWHSLGVEALRQGNHQIVEMAYQRTKNFERLSFLYLITGNREKLKKMLKIAEMRRDVCACFQNALFLGDASQRCKILLEAGQYTLAYACAKTHGLEAQAALAVEHMDGVVPELPPLTAGRSAGPELLAPPTPIMRLHEDNWPLLTKSQGLFERFASQHQGELPPEEELEVPQGGWGEDDLDLDAPLETEETAAEELQEGDGWGGDDDLDLGDVGEIEAALSGTRLSADTYTPPTMRDGPEKFWLDSRHACDHIAAGSFDSAMGLLKVSAGVGHFAPLKDYFLRIYTAAHANLVLDTGLLPIRVSLMGPDKYPLSIYTLDSLNATLKNAYQLTTNGKFNDALALFISILHQLLFVIVDRKEEADVRELIGICREYVTGLKMEILRKDAGANLTPQKRLELQCYFPHCHLQTVHTILALRSAMTAAYKAQCFSTAYSHAARLSSMGVASVVQQARKVMAACEKNLTDKIALDYDPKNPFTVCCKDFTPIYKGSALTRCAFCQAAYAPEHKGKICNVCEVGIIGAEASGLRSSR
eukprot:GCRY01003108.1.p1 GENE.GCRY01003108.1~~GCRY01003108.1.p1  ORF type:complete len:1215 (+),score=402.83 GCRY01003108.1:394-4038(+)